MAKKRPAPAGAASAAASPQKPWWESWRPSRNPILVFVLGFAVLLAIFYALTLSPVFKQRAFPAYLRWNAHTAHLILRVFGQGTVVAGTSVTSRAFGIDVRRGCDAVEPTALFIAAVLAFPALTRRKLPGVIAGALCLALLNLVRIVTLFLTGAYFPKAFEIMHGEIWQALFILFAIALWILWIRWALRAQAAEPVEPTPAG